MVLRVAGGPTRGRRLRAPLIYGGATDPRFKLVLDGQKSIAPGGYSRTGAFYLPQQDGSMAVCSDNALAREWDGSRWCYRTDPSWSNSFCNKTVGGLLTLGTSETVGLSGRPLNKAVIQSGLFSYAQVGGANSLNFAATSGQFVDMSLQGFIGASTGPMSLGMMVVSAITTGPATNANFSGFKVSATGAVSGKFLGSGVTELEQPTVTLVSPGVWKFQWLLRYTQGATVRDTARMYLEILDSAGSAVNINGDGVSAVHWELCQHALAGYHPPIADTTTAPVTVNNHSWITSTSALGFSVGGQFTLHTEYATLDNSSQDRLICGLSSGAFANSIYVNPRNAALQRGVAMISGGSPQLEATSIPAISDDSLQRLSVRAKVNDTRAVFSGSMTPGDAACSLPVGLTNLSIGCAPWGGTVNNAAMRIYRIAVAPIDAIPDSELPYLANIWDPIGLNFYDPASSGFMSLHSVGVA